MTTIATKYPFLGSIETRQGGRKENQDNFGFIDTPLGLLLVVCDGMGGGPGGRTASQMAVETILSTLENISENTNRKDALNFAINNANSAIYAESSQKQELRGMGTTIVAVLINETSAVIAHAGDSRLYQLRKGKIIFRTADHSLVASLVRQKKLSEEEARNSPRSNIVTRALGIKAEETIEFDEVSFRCGDRFVLCTDGIWGALPQEELTERLCRATGIAELTTTIAEEIDAIGNSQGGGHDNLTLGIIDTPFDSSAIIRRRKGMRIASSVLLTLLVGAGIGAGIRLSLAGEKEKTMPHKEIVNPIKEKTNPIIPDDATEAEPEAKDSSENVQEENQPNSFVRHDAKEDDTSGLTDFERQRQKEVRERITKIVTHLEGLQKIKGKNQKKGQQQKKEFLQQKDIQKDVENLKRILDKKEHQSVDEIQKMLNDRKTTACSKRGDSTRESNQHIKSIIDKLQSLMK